MKRPASSTLTTPDKSQNRPHIVLVSGLFSPSVVMWPLAWRLRKEGYAVSTFSRHYPFCGATAAASQLQQHLRSLDSDELHLVAHSYGGIVLLRLFEQLGQLRPDEGSESASVESVTAAIRSCIFIASPLAGAQLAVNLASGRAGFFWKRALGKSLPDGLSGGPLRGEIPENSAFITGDRKSLLSQLLQRSSEIGDGLVLFSETLASEQPATRHISLPQTHAGLLFSRRCCSLIVEFVGNGRFTC